MAYSKCASVITVPGIGGSVMLQCCCCLQDAGLLIGRKEHGAHHKAPFIAKYSIVSGWVNPWLDGSCPGGGLEKHEAWWLWGERCWVMWL